MVRIVLVPAFVTLLVYGYQGAALAVFATAALTDLLDGYVARRHGSQSRLGAFLDPLADKLLMTASFVTLAALGALPFWIAAVVLSRDIVLVAGVVLVHLLGARVHPRPTRAGKAAMFFQILAVLGGLVRGFVPLGVALDAVLWLAAAFTVFSGLQYLLHGLRFLDGAHAESDEQPSRHTILR